MNPLEELATRLLKQLLDGTGARLSVKVEIELVADRKENDAKQR